jgi:hypothetical protein
LYKQATPPNVSNTWKALSHFPHTDSMLCTQSKREGAHSKEQSERLNRGVRKQEIPPNTGEHGKRRGTQKLTSLKRPRVMARAHSNELSER